MGLSAKIEKAVLYSWLMFFASKKLSTFWIVPMAKIKFWGKDILSLATTTRVLDNLSLESVVLPKASNQERMR